MALTGAAHAQDSGSLAPAPDDRDALVRAWNGMYDISEQALAGFETQAPLAPMSREQRLQVSVRRVQLPWMGTHVLLLEEFPFDQPFEARRRVLLAIEPGPGLDGSLRVRQFTWRSSIANAADLGREDVETMPGCDLHLRRVGAQFRGGTQGRNCLDPHAGEPGWLDYRVVVGDGVYWYRQRRLTVADNELAEEIAGFPHANFDDARLFSCGLSWKANGARRARETVDLHDRGGRARLRAPDGRDLLLELHGRDWPLSTRRESLVLVLTDLRTDEVLGSSWTSLGAARVGLELGWVAIDCAPIVSETGEDVS